MFGQLEAKMKTNKAINILNSIKRGPQMATKRQTV